MPNYEMGYDDETVTLGDGTVDVDMGAHGIQKVRGSRSFVRDPRLSPLVKGRPGASRPEQIRLRIPSDSKWCAACGDVRPRHYFSPKKDSFDGLDPRCKACEAERKRKGYQVSVNRDVRPYARREKAAG